MANDFVFTEEEMAVDGGLGYPTTFAKLCRDRSFGPFSHGPWPALYLHPLCFGSTRGGGLTVPSNVRILQWQVCRRKHNKLEF
ncbi:titin isoform X2 [Salvia divinorum]|uniref:Titin isoform X2 n=1 Tax=Salvia divinorum TaxID=28513 RepID=A0ABD1GWY3_SALDI